MSAPSGLRELILYATPTGDLQRQCDAYFEHLNLRGWHTTAQTYPPHITLTGFFWRSPATHAQVVRSVGAVVEEFGPIEPDAVRIERIGHHDAWVGLEISSQALADLTHRVVGADIYNPDEDAMRPKDWLHLSLAYGDLAGGAKLTDLANLARVLVDPNASAGWEVGLWERLPNGRAVHGANWQRIELAPH